MSFQTMPTSAYQSGWGSVGAPTGQFPPMASGTPSGTTAGLPPSGGFRATGVPSVSQAGIPGSLGSTASPWGAFTGDPTNFNNIAQLTGQIIPGAINASTPYYTSAIGAAQKYGKAGTADINSLYGSALRSLQGDYGGANTALNTAFAQAAQPYQQLYGGAQAGVDAYKAALGLAGPDQQAAAVAAFMNNPAMQSQLKLGDAAVLAQKAAAGETGSGKELIALDQYNQLVGQQMWGQYLQGLQPFMGQQSMAAQGLGGVFQNLGQNEANIYTQLGQQTAGTQTQQAQQLANIQAMLGQEVPAGLNTIGSEMFAGPMMGLGYLTQDQMAAYNAAAAASAAQTGLFSGILGAGATLGSAALKFSDVNVKENIEPVGKLADGMNIYRYNYKGDVTPQIGLLAQEVEQVAPEAVQDILPGVKGVNYALATNRAAELMKFSNDNVSSPLVIYGDALMERAAA